MKYGQRQLEKAKVLYSNSPYLQDILDHWRIEIAHERAIELDYKERKAYEDMGLEYPF